MKRQIMISLSVTAAIAILGCGGWKQDPLKDKDSIFRDAQPGPRKPDLTKPIRSDAVNIAAPDFFSFEEEKADSFTVVSRVLIENYAVTTVLENMEEFPGATFDPVTGKFEWRPPRGHISNVGQGAMASQILKIAVYGELPGKAVLFNRKEIDVRITRSFEAPTIVSVRKDRPTLREGEVGSIEVLVRDRDATPDRLTWPKLTIASRPGSKTFAGFTKVQAIDSRANSQFLITLRVDLRNAEVTATGEDFLIELFAVSNFGKTSQRADVSYTIFTTLTEPVTSWTGVFELIPGEKKDLPFLISDPKQEAVINVTSVQKPNAAVVLCMSDTAMAGAILCRMQWTPETGEAGNHNLRIAIEYRSKDPRDPQRHTKTFTLPMLVKGN